MTNPSDDHIAWLAEMVQRLDKGGYDDRIVLSIYQAKKILAQISARSLAEVSNTDGRHQVSTLIDAGSSPAGRASPSPEPNEPQKYTGTREQLGCTLCRESIWSHICPVQPAEKSASEPTPPQPDPRWALIAELTKWAADWAVYRGPAEKPVDKGWRLAAEEVQSMIQKSSEKSGGGQ